MTRPTFPRLGCTLALVLAGGGLFTNFRVTNVRANEPAPAPEKQERTQADLEKQFAETMSQATLVGKFTTVGQNTVGQDRVGQDAGQLKDERYTLGRVSKLKGDYWLFETRIQYGDHDVRLPLTLQVKWAGDTPVITLTDVAIPGLGTFTARVLVYRGQYAGTWSGATHGGQLFGKIEQPAAERATDAKNAKP